MLVVLAFSVYKREIMTGIILFVKRKSLTIKSLLALMAGMFFSFINDATLNAQELDYHFGVRGGVGMSTLSGFQNNGLKLGLTAGGYAKFIFDENNSIDVELSYSTGGQQSQKWLDNNEAQVKVYNKYSLHYLNLPILYQYYFTDILGIEGGLNFRYCMAGSLKSKIGNESWHSVSFGKDSYNRFDMGLSMGVYTENFIPSDHFFVSLRAYFGFIDVVKNVGNNKNVSVQVSVGYMF